MSVGAEAASHSNDRSNDDRANAPETSTHQASAPQDWVGNLRGLVSTLGEMATSYEGLPRRLDSTLDATEKAIGGINEIFRDLCDKGRPLLGESTWQAFKDEEDKYALFYEAIWLALDTYREGLEAYRIVGPGAQPPPERSDFPQVDQNAELFAKRRWECIKALRDLYRYLSGMLDSVPA
jgi:hypothetical protein